VSSRVATVGFAPHSGWAALVALGGTPERPHVLARARVDLIDHEDPHSKQPHHAVESVGIEAAARRLEDFLEVAVRLAHSAIQALAEDLAARGHRISAVGILDSAGRKGSSLAAILASHALIHAGRECARRRRHSAGK